MIRRFVFLQAAVTMVAAIACPASHAGLPVPIGPVLFRGIIGAQASLIGLWLAQGASSSLARWITSLAGLAWLGVAMALRPHFNGWELLLLALRTAVVGGVFWGLRHCGGYVLKPSTDAEQGLPFQFRIGHLLLLTLAVALVMGTMQLAEDTELGMYLYLLLVAAGLASLTLVPCWAVFGRGGVTWRLFAFAIVFLLIGTALSYAAYYQTGYPVVAIGWALCSTAEAAFAILSLYWLRRLGYRMTRPETPSRRGI
jgi:hypothetical protein